ncbi:HNH endonuclease family protein [Actinomadura rubrisoli]|uniref:HNH endonuclease n=1 Tax=Actinomadura rubrisoli TaxID=2530368 RepID=A0A4R5CA74_9ACTN|nr:HNH endonuclease family protein [Actinomadura rubrisoli]TDD93932.1 HNH endonuclease [Actinomadura rubrisoli]
MRRLAVPAALAAAFLAAAPAASAEPPPPPGEAEAAQRLAGLTIAAEGSMTGYSRQKFPHWITVSGTCNTRETVLKRDGDNVQADAQCAAVSGTWTSPYDGGRWTKASDLDIDHMVPLAQAWRSGADRWTTDRRRQFANDLTSSQLWTVTDNVNQAKGDKDPAQWKPPLTSFYCTYARSWIDVKHRYGLTVDQAEKSALAELLQTC